MATPDWLQAATQRGTAEEDAAILAELLAIKWGHIQQEYLDNEFYPAVNALAPTDSVRSLLGLADGYRRFGDALEQSIRNHPDLAQFVPPDR